MKPRTAAELAAYFADDDEGPRYPCERHGFRESIEPVALRQCGQCRADAEARYADGAPLAPLADEKRRENQIYLGRGRTFGWRN